MSMTSLTKKNRRLSNTGDECIKTLNNRRKYSHVSINKTCIYTSVFCLWWYNLSSWGWAACCSKHVEDRSV